MRITVITVARNAEATIADCIASVARQSHPEVEHILIDGASSDETVARARGTKNRLARVVSEPDNGIYDAMNKGIRLATGEVIGFLNSDDFFADERVLSEVATALRDPSVDGCYADLVYVSTEDSSRIVRYWKSRPYEPGLCLTGWMPAHPTFYVRRRVYEAFGGFDCEFRRQADFELTTRMLEVHRIRTAYVPRVWVRMRVGGLSNRSLRGVTKGNLEAYRALRKLGFAVTPLFMARKVLSRLPQFFSRPPRRL